MTRIVSISNYGFHLHLLPEEMTDAILDDLKKSKSDIEIIIEEDKKIIKDLLKKKIKKLHLMNQILMKL